MSKAPYADYLLPDTVVPEQYNISLDLDFDGNKFTGREDISVNIKAGSTTPDGTLSITLHSVDLELSNVELVLCYQALRADNITYNKERQEATLLFSHVPRMGVDTLASLHIEFSGALVEGLTGLYKTQYRRRDGTNAYGAATQFEATDARRCFPCWDEPAKKAVFILTVAVPSQFTVVSNNVVHEITENDDKTRKTFTFEPTPKMSTYLVGIFVSEYDVLSKDTVDGVKVSVYTPPNRSAEGVFALDVAVKCLEFLASAFQVPYPLTKCDLISVEDLSAAAMENWGAVSFRSSYLLVGPSTPTLVKQTVALVVCHELAHQWFGNLVTMSWWSWLGNNESWANFIEYLCVDHIFPEWNIFAQFNRSVAPAGFQAAALASTHPIQVHVGDPAEVSEIFDEVTYDAGAIAIRTLYSFLGAEAFFKGLQHYFKLYAYSDCTTDELWKAFEDTSGLPIASIMSKFVGNDGFPYVAVSHDAHSHLHLHCGRYVAPWAHNGDAWPEDASAEVKTAMLEAATNGIAGYHKLKQLLTHSEADAQKWNIPVNALTVKACGSLQRHTAGVLMLASADADKTVSEVANKLTAAVAGSTAFKLNVGNGMLYRSVYSRDLLLALLKSWDVLPVEEQAGLADEIGQNTMNGFLPSDSIILLANQCSNPHKMSYDVFNRVAYWLNAQLHVTATDKELYEEIRAYKATFLTPYIAEFGWTGKDGDRPDASLLRASILQEAVNVGNAECVAEALRRFDAFLADPSAIHPDQKSLLLTAASRYGGSDAFEKLLQFYRKSTNSDDQRKALLALGGAATPELIQRALDWSLTEEVRTGEVDTVISAASKAHWANGPEITWQWGDKSWPELMRRFGQGTFMLPYVVEGICSPYFASKRDHDRVKAFFTTHEHPGAERCVKQLYEGIRGRAWQAQLFSASKDSIIKALRVLRSIA